MKYTSRSLRQRGNADKWEVRLSHKDPISGKQVSTYHTIEARTQKQAERTRDELILNLERRGGALGKKITVRDLLEHFIDYKEDSGTVEPSTISGYRYEVRHICSYIGNEELSELNISIINKWMADMTKEGYSPRTVCKHFRLLKQAINYAIALDLLVKNPYNFCKPPKRV